MTIVVSTMVILFSTWPLKMIYYIVKIYPFALISLCEHLFSVPHMYNLFWWKLVPEKNFVVETPKG